MPDVLETLKKLPPLCYTTERSSGKTIMIKRGERGYYPVDSAMTPSQLNAKQNPCPTAAQIWAMENGSCFGWEVPGADPDECALLMASNGGARR